MGTPKKGHHIFNNISKLVRDTIDENYPIIVEQAWTHDNFGDFYSDMVVKGKNGFSKDDFPETWHDYQYWSPKSEVSQSRDKLAMMSRPKGSEDTNIKEYSTAAGKFKEAAREYLKYLAWGGEKGEEKGGELFSAVQTAAEKVQSNYVDKGIEEFFLESTETPQKDKDLYEDVKMKLEDLFKSLPDRVEKWGLEMQYYYKVKTS